MTPHGIMFHHFHDGIRHPMVQGSLSADDLHRLLDRVEKDSTILPAQTWVNHARADTLDPSWVCLTFDDGLASQYDVARPVLRERGLTGIWHLYTAPLVGVPLMLEVDRWVRTTQFPTMETFYDTFEKTLTTRGLSLISPPPEFLAAHPYLSYRDRVFRYHRDNVLPPQTYRHVMDTIRTSVTNTTLKELRTWLWMFPAELITLKSEGHVFGLHSHSHPTRMERLPWDAQWLEYATNAFVLRMLGLRPQTMAHPCNAYTPQTLTLLRDLGFTVGFRATMEDIPHRSTLEYPRENCANLR